MKNKASKSSRKEQLNVEAISVALPSSTNHEHRLVVHERAPTEAPETEEIPGDDSIAAQDMGHEDRV